MRAMASQITCLSIVYSTVIQAQMKETAELCVTGLCEGNSLVTGEFPTQRASNAENVSIWWCHHDILVYYLVGKGRLWSQLTEPVRPALPRWVYLSPAYLRNGLAVLIVKVPVECKYNFQNELNNQKFYTKSKFNVVAKQHHSMKSITLFDFQ